MNPLEILNGLPVVIPEKKKIELVTESEKVLKTANGITIKKDQDYHNAAEFLKCVKKASKALEDERKTFTVPLDDKKKEIMAFFKQPVGNISTAESIVKGKLLDYDRKKQKEAEDRIAMELARQKSEEKKLADEIAQLEADGNEEEAYMKEKQLEDLQTTAPAIPINQHKQGTGLSTRIVWKGKVEDRWVLFNWLLQHQEYIDLIEINQGALNKLVNNTAGRLKINGVRIFKEEIAVSRTM